MTRNRRRPLQYAHRRSSRRNDARPPVLNGPAQALAAWQRSPIVRLTIVAALLSAGKVLLYTAGTTLFLSRQGIDALPALYLTLAVIATGVSLLLAAVIDRATPAWLLPGLAILVALAMSALLVGLGVDWELVPAAILIAAHVYDIVTDIVFWLLAAALLDNLRLRRHTPRLFIAIAVGGSVAGIIAERALATVAIEHLLWPVVGLVCIAVALFGKAAAGLAAAAETDPSDAGQPIEKFRPRPLGGSAAVPGPPPVCALPGTQLAAADHRLQPHRVRGLCGLQRSHPGRGRAGPSVGSAVRRLAGCRAGRSLVRRTRHGRACRPNAAQPALSAHLAGLSPRTSVPASARLGRARPHQHRSRLQRRVRAGQCNELRRLADQGAWPGAHPRRWHILPARDGLRRTRADVLAGG